MKTGDLLRFSNRPNGSYSIVVAEKAHDPHSGKYLPECVMIALFAVPGAIIPMDKKFLRVVSSAK